MSTDRLLILVPSSRISDRSQANKPMISTAEVKEVKSTVLTMMMSSVFTVSAILQFPGILGRRRRKRPFLPGSAKIRGRDSPSKRFKWPSPTLSLAENG